MFRGARLTPGAASSVPGEEHHSRGLTSRLRLRGVARFPCLPESLSRPPCAPAVIALAALLMSGATPGLVTPVHAASDGDLRIEDGPSDNEGRLEIFHDGRWGAVCDDYFSNVDAGVACRQLGYSGGLDRGNRRHAPAGMEFWLDNVGCSGSEPRLDMCPHPGWGKHSCQAREAVSVRCTGTRQVPASLPAPKPATGLAASGTTTAAINLSWTLPAQPLGVTVARVELRRLVGTTWRTGAMLGAAATTHSVRGLSEGADYSFRIRLITSAGIADSDPVTSAKPATGLSASGATPTSVSLSWALPSQSADVSVTGVEVRQLSGVTWSTVATLAADATSHTVTGLSAGTAYSFRIRLVTSRGSVDSPAYSLTLSALAVVTPVRAVFDGDLRIQDGPSDNEGRLEIFHDGEWGGVCDDFFRDVDAGVACRQMGHSSGRVLSEGNPLPAGKRLWLTDVDCDGTESRLERCRHDGWGQAPYCNEREAVSVSCEGDPPAPVETVEPPGEPVEPTLRALSTSSIEALWTVPASSAAITGYGYRYREFSSTGSQRQWTSATTTGTRATLTGLRTGTEYEVQIRAVSANGTGAWSSRSTRRTRRASAVDCAGYTPPPGAIWSNCLTVGAYLPLLHKRTGGRLGYHTTADSGANPYGSLSSPQFTSDGTQYTVRTIQSAKLPRLLYVVVLPDPGDAADDWVLHIGNDFAFSFSDAEPWAYPGGRAEGGYQWRYPGFYWSIGDIGARVPVSLVSSTSDGAPAAGNDLASLSLDGLALDPAFDGETTAYAATAPAYRTRATLRAAAVSGSVAVAPEDADPWADGHQVPLAEGETEVRVTVTPADASAAKAYTVTVARESADTGVPGWGAPTRVPADWSLAPPGLSPGDRFRLLAVTSTKHYATANSIARYNGHVQAALAGGHADIRSHGPDFRALGCAIGVDARTNTATAWTASGRGVPVYWLGGDKVADDYADLYDGSWDSNAPRDESGGSVSSPRVFTGCASDGTTGDQLGDRGGVDNGRPGTSGQEFNDGRTHMYAAVLGPLYALSPVFQVAGLGAPSVEAEAGDGEVTLSWTAPEYVGTITGWEVRHGVSDADRGEVDWGDWEAIESATAETATHPVTGLENGTAYGFELRAMAGEVEGSASGPVSATPAAPERLRTKMAGSVPDAGVKETDRSDSPPGGCAVEVSVEFLDAGGEAVSVDALAATDFTMTNGRAGTPVADADGLGWTVPVRATTNERGFIRVRLPATAHWRAAEQVFRNRAGVCAPAARGELASLWIDDLDISPIFASATTSYTAETTDAEAEVVATAVYADATVTIAPGDADEERDGHQLALAEGETEVTVTVTPGDGSDARTYTVTVTREPAVTGAGVLTGLVLVDAVTDADLGPITEGGTVTVSAVGIYGIRAEVDPDAAVGSVVLTLSNPVAKSEEHRQTENVVPYSLFGDAEGAEHGRALAAGSYTLTATAHEHPHGAGKALGTLRAPFKVEVEAGTESSPGVLSGFVLLDASDQSTVAALTDGAEIDLGGRSGGTFAIRANVVTNATVGSVALSLSGAKTVSRTENIAPYSLWGDHNDGNGGRALDGASLPAGTYTLSATAYAERRASGATLGTRSVSFEVLAPALLSVADAQAEEGTDATLDFAVTLDRETTNTVTVEYATSDGTALAGSDYTATSGTLTFQPGETEKTVSVPVLEDDHDEGSETLTLRLSNAEGARIADGEATGTTTNEGPIPQAWLARFGRTVTGQVLEAVEARLAAPRAAGAEASLAGQALPSWRGGDAAAANPGPEAGPGDGAASEAALLAEAENRAALASMTAWLTQTGRDGRGLSGPDTHGDDGAQFETRALTQRDLIVGTSFALTGGYAEGGGFASLWGRASIAGFDGREGSLTVDGEVTTALVGADWASDPGAGSGRWTAGLALGHSTGTGGWRSANGSGAIEAVLTGLYPYAGMDLTERLSVWAAAGHGSGEVTVTPEGEAGLTADLAMAMGAAGVRSDVLRPEGGEGLALAVKGDARFTRTSSDAVRSASGNLAASEADVWLLRTGLEGSRPVALGESGVTLTPSFEIGLRLDGGDAETGLGADLGGGLVFSDPAHGLSFDMTARGLVAHASPGFREWGASLSGSWDPRPATDLGLALSLRQSWGASPAGGMDALLSRETLAGLAAADDGAGRFEASRRLDGEAGYGIALPGGVLTGTPNVGFGLSAGGARDWRVGWRVTAATAGGAGIEVSVDATRSEAANDDEPPERGAMLRGSVRW